MSILTEHLPLLRSFLRTDYRKCILLCAAGFLAAALAGYFIGVTSPETVESVINLFLETAEQSGVFEDDGTISTFALLSNNWTATKKCKQ